VDTRPFDPAQYLDSEEAIAAYLADAGADGDKALSEATEVVARARKGLTAAPSAAGVAESGAGSFRRDSDKS
jgi:DNA-binding phage protein